MKKALFIFIILNLSYLNSQTQDLTYLLSDLEFDLAVGNGCGQFNDEGYRQIFTNGLELNDHQLDAMYVELTIYGQPTNLGVEYDIMDLIFDEKIRLICEISEEYQYETTIIVLDETLSVPQEESNQIKIYPNPATNRVNIKGQNLSKIICYDITGKKMWQILNPVEVNQVNLFNYSSGIYLIHIFDNQGGIKTERLIIAN